MYRREFIRNSSLVVGAAIIGLPKFADAFEQETAGLQDTSRPRLKGHKRLGCARTLDDPKIALQIPSDSSIQFA